MNFILLIVLLAFSGNDIINPSIIGSWANEEDSKLFLEFTSSGGLIEEYGDVVKSRTQVSSRYFILERSQSCSKWENDEANQMYLKIENVKLGIADCFYLETLTENKLLLMNSNTGKILVFRKVQ